MTLLSTIIDAYRLHRLRMDLEQRLHWQKLIRQARSEAAKRGVSSEWRRRGEQCRKVFS